MKKRNNYFYKLSNPFFWCSILLLIGSFVVRYCSYLFLQGHNEKGFSFQIYMMAISTALYIFVMIVHAKQRLYRLSVPVLIGCFTLAIDACSYSQWHMLLCLVVYIVIFIVLFQTFSGKLHSKLIPISLLMVTVIVQFVIYLRNHFNLLQLGIGTFELSSIVIALGLCSSVVALQKRPDDGTYYPTWGDRPDGRRLHTLYPLNIVSPFIMVTRNASSNFIRDSVEITEMEEYIRKKRKEGLSNFGIQHVFVASYIRAVSKFPGINRFISGQRIYARHNVEVVMAIKKDMSLNGSETMIDMVFQPNETAYSVYGVFNQKVDSVKNTPLNSNFDGVASFFSKIPSVIMKFTVWLIKTFDYFGLLPKFLLDVSPFHCSMLITSMGSLGIPPIYHHLYDFGNLPVFISFGAKRRVNELQSDGSIRTRKYIDFTVVTDERICDGYYYASALKYIKRCLSHPEQLDNPPEIVTTDID